MADIAQKLDSVGRVTGIMELLCSSDETYTIREIEDLTGIPRSTLHRILLSLERREWVYRDAQTEKFRPGIRFFLLNNRSLFYRELTNAAAPEMERLVADTGQTAIMSVLEGLSGLCIHHVEPPQAVKYVAHRGMSIPLYAGATGKVMLAFCREDIRRRIMGSGLPEEIDKTELAAQLETIKSQGYCLSKEEWIDHAGDISVPVFDRLGDFAAQLGLAGLAASFEGREGALLTRLREAAATIGDSL